MNQYGQAFHETIRRFLAEEELYTLLAKGASRILRSELAKRSIEVFSVTWRSKSLPSVLEKLERKSYQELDDIIDRAGIRVICIYANGIQPALDTVNELFLVQKMEDTTKRGGPSSFGYGSHHCLAKWNPKHPGPVMFEDLKYYLRYNLEGKPIEGETKKKRQSHIDATNKAAHNIQIEIQVRTILQHAWASISHQILYKHEPNVSESDQRKMARLAAILEEIDEAFAEQIDLSTALHLQKGTLLRIPDQPLTIGYLQEYSKAVLGLDLPEKEAGWALHDAKALRIKNVLEFEDLMVSTLEALEAAFSSIFLRHLKSLWIYMSTVAAWANVIETPLVPSQQQVLDYYRGLVHEELFQRILLRLQGQEI